MIYDHIRNFTLVNQSSRLPGPFGGKLIFKMVVMHDDVSKWRVFKKAPQVMSMQDKAALMSIQNDVIINVRVTVLRQEERLALHVTSSLLYFS